MQFAHPYRFWLILLLPLCVLLYAYHLYKQRQLLGTKKNASIHYGHLLEAYSPVRMHLKFGFILLAMLFFVIAYAGPRVPGKKQKAFIRGIDVIIALDLSQSMMAEDIKPNRLERAKTFISDLMKKMPNDRIGLIVFAGNAYMQMPLTIDHSSIEMYLQILNTTIVPTQGTAIGEAIRIAGESFETGKALNGALIILSDGETHDEEALQAARNLYQKEGIPIFTIGVGTTTGAPIPVYNRYGQRIDFKKDKEAKIILSKLNEKMLARLAEASEGSYALLKGRETAYQLAQKLDAIEAKAIAEQSVTQYRYYHRIVLFIGLISLLTGLFMATRQQKQNILLRWRAS